MPIMSIRSRALALLLASLCCATAQDSAPKPAPAPPRDGPPDGRLPKLPAAITSFGAAVADGSLYLYGGHIGKAHAHSRDNLADAFVRLDLNRPQQWESLPMQEKLQGLAMVAWQGSVIRIGGVNARNAA